VFANGYEYRATASQHFTEYQSYQTPARRPENKSTDKKYGLIIVELASAR